jgi:hypothetical protein
VVRSDCGGISALSEQICTAETRKHMTFYKIEAKITNASTTSGDYGDCYEQSKLLQTKQALYHEKRGNDCLIFICSTKKQELILLGVAAVSDIKIASEISQFLAAVGIEVCDIKTEEITLSSVLSLSELSETNHFCEQYIVLDSLKLNALRNRSTALHPKEVMLSADVSKEARLNQASRLLAGDVDKISSDELTRLVADDFEELPTLSKGTASIGFLG